MTITGIEEALLKVGQVVAKRLAVAWLGDRRADSRRGRDLSALVGARFPVRRKERDVLDSLVRIEDEAASRLAPTLARAAHGLPDHERDAALAAVTDVLEDADLSDAALFDIDLDAGALAAEIRRRVPATRAGLSERATGFYEVALRQACVVLVHLIRELPEFDAATAVEDLRRLTTVMHRLDDVLARLPAPDLDAPAGTDTDTQFHRRYLVSVGRCYDHLEIIGLTTHHYEPTTTLSVAYLSLSATAESGRGSRSSPRADRVGMDWWHQRDHGPARPAENLRVEAALGEGDRTVLHGEAGAGKSTLLRWLAVNAARGGFTDRLAGWNGCVPILVTLRDFADRPLPRGDDLLRQPGSPECGPVPAEWAHRQLAAGRVLLLVDGVDELARRQRDGVRDWLRGLVGQYPEIRVVVTSRPTAITPTWLAAEGFRSVVLEPMNPADVQVFLHRWHQALLHSVSDPALLPCPRAEVPEHERTLLAQLKSRPHLRALARNPLLCAMLCALNLDRRAKLPRDRLALYSAALDMLLERRDADRGVASAEGVRITTGEKLVLLRALAWWLNENGRSQLGREQALDRFAERLRGMATVQHRYTADELLDHLVERSGVIRAPVVGKIDFLHRTFQEYLAAKEAVDRDSVDLLIRNARLDLWRETVLMACAHASAEQRGRLLNGILDAAATAGPRVARQLRLLAAACRETATLIDPPETIDRLDETIRGLLPPRGVREARSLATVGEAILDYLPATVDDLSPAQGAACVRTAALVNGPRALELLASYATCPATEVQEELIAAWRYFDPEQYAKRVLADAPLPVRIEVDSAAAVPHLKHLRNLRGCHVGLWEKGPLDTVVRDLSRLGQLENLAVLGDAAPATLPELGRLHKLTHLFLNFRNDWPPDMGFLRKLTELRYLGLVNADAIRDLGFLTKMPDLVEANLPDAPIAELADSLRHPDHLLALTHRLRHPKDLQVIAERLPALNQLDLDDCPSLDDLTPLAGLPLRWLSFWRCQSVNLPVAEFSQLRTLILSRVTEPVDLTPLAHATITICLYRGVQVTGVDKLGPGVKLRGPGAKGLT